MSKIAHIIHTQEVPAEKVADKLTEDIARVLEASKARLWLSTQRSGGVFFCAGSYDPGVGDDRSLQEWAWPEGLGLLAALPQNAFSAWPSLPSTPSLSVHAPWASAEAETKDTLILPVISRGMPIGFYTVLHPRSNDHRSDTAWLASISLFPPEFARSLQRNHYEHVLERRVSLLNSAIESVAEGIAVTGLDRRILMTNQAFVSMMEVSLAPGQRVEGFTIRDLLLNRVQSPEKTVAEADELYENPGLSRVHQIEYKDGRTFERYSKPYLFEGKIAGRVFSYREITQRVRTEAAKERLQAQLRQFRQMEAVGTLAAGIAHDFNGIINVVKCNAALLRSSTPAGQSRAEALAGIDAALARASELVERVLMFGHDQPLPSTAFDLAEIVAQEVRLLRPSIPASIEIRTSIVGRPTVMTDRSQFHRLISNLFNNAAHAIGEKSGRIEVHAEATAMTDEAARQHPGLRAGSYVVLSVSDDGCGMTKETMERIFEPFFTTKVRGKGSGLGLAVVYGLMRSHGGTAVASSDPGHGTCIDLYFPEAAGLI